MRLITRSINMVSDVDPNVIYGGDPENVIDDSILSLGSMMHEDIEIGGDRNLFVSRNFEINGQGQIHSRIYSKINGMTNEIWTYRDLLNHSILAAKALHGAGLKKDDVVAVISENRHEFPAAAFAAFYLNAIVAPINVTYTERKSRSSASII